MDFFKGFLKLITFLVVFVVSAVVSIFVTALFGVILPSFLYLVIALLSAWYLVFKKRWRKTQENNKYVEFQPESDSGIFDNNGNDLLNPTRQNPARQNPTSQNTARQNTARQNTARQNPTSQNTARQTNYFDLSSILPLVDLTDFDTSDDDDIEVQYNEIEHDDNDN